MIDLFYPHGHNEFMQFLPFTIFMALFITGCASYHTKAPAKPKPAVHKPQLKIPSPKLDKTSKTSATGAVWEYLSGDKLTLQFKNIDNGSNLTVIIEKGISERTVEAGHWELTGFEKKGTSYVSMNTSKKFVFRMSDKNNVYAGSIVIGCPQITSGDNKHLKRMKFFNRYPFSTSSGLCEVIVGNDFIGVREKLKKMRKNKKLNLILGF